MKCDKSNAWRLGRGGQEYLIQRYAAITTFLSCGKPLLFSYGVAVNHQSVSPAAVAYTGKK